MYNYLELPKQQIKAIERPPVALFLCPDQTGPQTPAERMAQLSLQVKQSFGELIVGNCMDLSYTVDGCTNAASKVTIACGPVPKEPDAWCWTVECVSPSARDVLSSKVMWGASNWLRIGKHDQGRLWRTTYDMQPSEAIPAMQAQGATADWQCMVRDHQGGLHRSGLYNDHDGALADFIGQALSSSDLAAQAEVVRQKREEKKEQYRLKPPHHYSKQGAVYKHIGFKGNTLTPTHYASPNFFVDHRLRSERVVERADLSMLTDYMLEQTTPEFRVWASY